jgi:hypothetical protein
MAAPALASADLSLHASHLKPGFAPAIHDYTTSCKGKTRLAARATGHSEARIGSGDWFSGADRRVLQLKPGQAVEVDVRGASKAKRYFIRCLPGDFAKFSFKRARRSAHSLYLVTNVTAKTLTHVPPSNYVFVIDSHGTPVWWMKAKPQGIDAKVLRDGSLAWARWYGGTYASDPRSAYEIHSLDGRLIRKVQTVGTVTDFHEMLETRKGNYIVESYRPRTNVNALAYNGDANATVLDGVIQEVTPKGKVVWEWSTADHISLAETGRWWTYTFGLKPYDIIHLNSLELLPDGDLLISLHNTDAVYRIDRPSGEVLWKLGGTDTPNSLTVNGDPYSYPLAGQHDARWLGHDEISVFDNGSLTAFKPRFVRYRVQNGAANYLESHSFDPVVYSNCCGSARLDRKRNSWLVSWGGNRYVTELDSKDRRTFTLKFSPKYVFSYRAVAVDNRLTLGGLRAGMAAQHPDAR